MDDAFFWCYPWDLLDDGLDAAVARLSGEIGVTGLTVAAVTASVDAVRPRIRPVRVRQPAAAHFRPDPTKYGATRIRPGGVSSKSGRNPLDLIAKAAGRSGLRLRARLTLFDNAALAQRHPMAACVDAYGQPSAARLCTNNPDVREYALAVIDDLTSHYPLSAIELESSDFAGRAASFASSECGVEPTEALSALLALCFCAACRQRADDAGLDPETVARSVRELADRVFHLDPTAPKSWIDVMESDDRTRAFAEGHSSASVRLVQTICNRAATPIVMHVVAAGRQNALDVAAARICHAVSIVPTRADGVSGAADLAGFISRCGGPERVEIGLAVHPPVTTDGPTLVRAVQHWVRAGHRTLGLSHYGMAPEPSLDWVRRALRFARRDGRIEAERPLKTG